jgi:DNA-binding FadR family transcriptional regulator
MFEREPVVGTMTAQVARTVGMRIVSGEFGPGDLLPVEGELCTSTMSAFVRMMQNTLV